MIYLECRAQSQACSRAGDQGDYYCRFWASGVCAGGVEGSGKGMGAALPLLGLVWAIAVAGLSQKVGGLW